MEPINQSNFSLQSIHLNVLDRTFSDDTIDDFITDKLSRSERFYLQHKKKETQSNPSFSLPQNLYLKFEPLLLINKRLILLKNSHKLSTLFNFIVFGGFAIYILERSLITYYQQNYSPYSFFEIDENHVYSDIDIQIQFNLINEEVVDLYLYFCKQNGYKIQPVDISLPIRLHKYFQTKYKKIFGECYPFSLRQNLETFSNYLHCQENELDISFLEKQSETLLTIDFTQFKIQDDCISCVNLNDQTFIDIATKTIHLINPLNANKKAFWKVIHQLTRKYRCNSWNDMNILWQKSYDRLKEQGISYGIASLICSLSDKHASKDICYSFCLFTHVYYLNLIPKSDLILVKTILSNIEEKETSLSIYNLLKKWKYDLDDYFTLLNFTSLFGLLVDRSQSKVFITKQFEEYHLQVFDKYATLIPYHSSKIVEKFELLSRKETFHFYIDSFCILIDHLVCGLIKQHEEEISFFDECYKIGLNLLKNDQINLNKAGYKILMILYQAKKKPIDSIFINKTPYIIASLNNKSIDLLVTILLDLLRFKISCNIPKGHWIESILKFKNLEYVLIGWYFFLKENDIFHHSQKEIYTHKFFCSKNLKDFFSINFPLYSSYLEIRFQELVSDKILSFDDVSLIYQYLQNPTIATTESILLNYLANPLYTDLKQYHLLIKIILEKMKNNFLKGLNFCKVFLEKTLNIEDDLKFKTLSPSFQKYFCRFAKDLIHQENYQKAYEIYLETKSMNLWKNFYVEEIYEYYLDLAEGFFFQPSILDVILNDLKLIPFVNQFTNSITKSLNTLLKFLNTERWSEEVDNELISIIKLYSKKKYRYVLFRILLENILLKAPISKISNKFIVCDFISKNAKDKVPFRSTTSTLLKNFFSKIQLNTFVLSLLEKGIYSESVDDIILFLKGENFSSTVELYITVRLKQKDLFNSNKMFSLFVKNFSSFFTIIHLEFIFNSVTNIKNTQIVQILLAILIEKKWIHQFFKHFLYWQEYLINKNDYPLAVHNWTSIDIYHQDSLLKIKDKFYCLEEFYKSISKSDLIFTEFLKENYQLILKDILLLKEDSDVKYILIKSIYPFVKKSELLINYIPLLINTAIQVRYLNFTLQIYDEASSLINDIRLWLRYTQLYLSHNHQVKNLKFLETQLLKVLDHNLDEISTDHYYSILKKILFTKKPSTFNKHLLAKISIPFFKKYENCFKEQTFYLFYKLFKSHIFYKIPCEFKLIDHFIKKANSYYALKTFNLSVGNTGKKSVILKQIFELPHNQKFFELFIKKIESIILNFDSTYESVIANYFCNCFENNPSIILKYILDKKIINLPLFKKLISHLDYDYEKIKPYITLIIEKEIYQTNLNEFLQAYFLTLKQIKKEDAYSIFFHFPIFLGYAVKAFKSFDTELKKHLFQLAYLVNTLILQVFLEDNKYDAKLLMHDHLTYRQFAQSQDETEKWDILCLKIALKETNFKKVLPFCYHVISLYVTEDKLNNKKFIPIILQIISNGLKNHYDENEKLYERKMVDFLQLLYKENYKYYYNVLPETSLCLPNNIAKELIQGLSQFLKNYEISSFTPTINEDICTKLVHFYKGNIQSLKELITYNNYYNLFLNKFIKLKNQIELCQFYFSTIWPQVFYPRESILVDLISKAKITMEIMKEPLEKKGFFIFCLIHFLMNLKETNNLKETLTHLFEIGSLYDNRFKNSQKLIDKIINYYYQTLNLKNQTQEITLFRNFFEKNVSEFESDFYEILSFILSSLSIKNPNLYVALTHCFYFCLESSKIENKTIIHELILDLALNKATACDPPTFLFNMHFCYSNFKEMQNKNNLIDLCCNIDYVNDLLIPLFFSIFFKNQKKTQKKMENFVDFIFEKFEVLKVVDLTSDIRIPCFISIIYILLTKNEPNYSKGFIEEKLLTLAHIIKNNPHQIITVYIEKNKNEVISYLDVMKRLITKFMPWDTDNKFIYSYVAILKEIFDKESSVDKKKILAQSINLCLNMFSLKNIPQEIVRIQMECLASIKENFGESHLLEFCKIDDTIEKLNLIISNVKNDKKKTSELKVWKKKMQVFKERFDEKK
mgnify:CR=1 FL=1